MKLIQGIMAAISAGMLIYAACCELLAADFILDVELKKSSIGIQALALFSLVMGLVGMAVLKCVLLQFPLLLGTNINLSFSMYEMFHFLCFYLCLLTNWFLTSMSSWH